MKKYARSVLSLLLAFCLLLPVIPARAAETANTVQYRTEEGSIHTIHWQQGIEAPVMPGELGHRDPEKLGAFHLEQATGYEGYVAPYAPGNGWYDINKFNPAGGFDSHLCFVASMTNLIHWWLDRNADHVKGYLDHLEGTGAAMANSLRTYAENRNRSGVSRPVEQLANTSSLYDNLLSRKFQGNSGGMPDFPADYFFNGYPVRRDGGRNTPDGLGAESAAGGGLFREVFGSSILTDRLERTTYETLDQNLKAYLDAGIGVVLDYTIKTGSHAVTLWGAEYDEQDHLCAVYLTDNNDTGYEEAMLRYRVLNVDGGSVITTRPDNDAKNRVRELILLTTAEEGWQAWEQTGKPLYEDGRAFLSPIASPHVHQLVYTARGAVIEERCTVPYCNHLGTVELRRADSEPLYETGAPIRPAVRTYVTNWLGGTVGEPRYENNVKAGTGRVVLTAQGRTAVLPFPILPDPARPQPEKPEPWDMGEASISGMIGNQIPTGIVTVEIPVTVPTGQEQQAAVLAAAYDGQGRQIGLTMVPVPTGAGQHTLTLTLDNANGQMDTLRVFLTGKDQSPLDQSQKLGK